MAKYREIRGRIQGIDNTAKITQAMKMVAAAKLRRAQDSIIAARPYGQKLREMLQFLASNVETAISPLLEEREVHRACLIVVAADRGLCGAFNSNVLKAATYLIENRYGALNAAGNLDIVCVGKRSADYFVKRGYNVIASYVGIFNALDFSVARNIINQVSSGFLERRFDRVEVIYNEFKSVVSQKLTVNRVLPVEVPTQATPVDYIFEEPPAEMLHVLLPRYVAMEFYRALLETAASEHAARMTAMEAATSNAGDMIDKLTLHMNRVRQASITSEIIEVVSGATAAE